MNLKLIRGQKHMGIASTLTPLKLFYIEVMAYYLYYCSCATYLLTVSTSLLWAVNIFNIFSHTYVQFTIFALTWCDFVLYSIVLPWSISDRVFQPWLTCFRCELFPILLKHNIRVFNKLFVVLGTLWPCSFHSWFWNLSLATNLRYVQYAYV